MKDQQLGGFGDYSDVGDVDMFGLDEFGNPAGLGAGWGAMIGGGVATGAAIIFRQLGKTSTSVYYWSEGLGALLGAATGGLMMISPKTRHAGLAALGVSLLTNGLRQIEMFFTPTPAEVSTVATQVATSMATTAAAAPAAAPAAPAAAPTTTGWGEPVMHTTGVIRPGLGIATIAPTGVVAPGFGDSGPQLVGSPQSMRTRQAQLVGVPQIGGGLAGLASSFGATVMGGGH